MNINNNLKLGIPQNETQIGNRGPDTGAAYKMACTEFLSVQAIPLVS